MQIQLQPSEPEGELQTLLRQSSCRARARDILCSIPGLGNVTAGAVLVECPEIGTMRRKQIAGLAGRAPMTKQPGSWHGGASIQVGRKHLYDALYMPASVAALLNLGLRQTYQRYQGMRGAGKPAKVALTALM